MHPFPPTESFTQIADHLRGAHASAPEDSPLPSILTFRGLGTVHGASMSIQFDWELTPTVYWGDKVIAPTADHEGFATKLRNSQELVLRLMYSVIESAPQALLSKGKVAQWTLYGEWCGSQIHGTSAVGNLPPRWLLTKICYTLADGAEVWLDVDRLSAFWTRHAQSSPWIFFVTDFPEYFIDLDITNPAPTQKELDRLMALIQKSCPIAERMGGEGPGEAILWEHTSPEYGTVRFYTAPPKN